MIAFGPSLWFVLAMICLWAVLSGRLSAGGCFVAALWLIIEAGLALLTVLALMGAGRRKILCRG